MDKLFGIPLNFAAKADTSLCHPSLNSARGKNQYYPLDLEFIFSLSRWVEQVQKALLKQCFPKCALTEMNTGLVKNNIVYFSYKSLRDTQKGSFAKREV